MTALQACRNPACSMLVFAWDTPWCSHDCARTDPPPPIVHAAGAIPPAVEAAVTYKINARSAVAKIAESMSRDPGGPVEITSQEWEALKVALPPQRPRYGVYNGEIGSLIGTPIVVADPTPKPGWLARVLRRLFG